MATFVREELESYTTEMLDPRNDFVFKMLFGQKKNTDLLLGLLNSILTVSVKKVVFINPHLEQENITDKASVMDVRVETLEGEQINLEIQMQHHKAFPERMLMYWVRMHASQDDAGKELIKLQKSIQKAYDELDRLSHDKEMRARALSRDMFLKDQAQYRYDAREEGREEGKEEGKLEGKKEIVELLYKKGSTPLEIASLLDMPLEIVEDYLN